MPHPKIQLLTPLVGRDDGIVQSYFGVKWEGMLWLVNAWLIDTTSGVAIPERMVRIDNLPARLQKCEPGGKFDYANVLLPKAVIDGPAEMAGYEIRVMPDAPQVTRDQLKPLHQVFNS